MLRGLECNPRRYPEPFGAWLAYVLQDRFEARHGMYVVFTNPLDRATTCALPWSFPAVPS